MRATYFPPATKKTNAPLRVHLFSRHRLRMEFRSNVIILTPLQNPQNFTYLDLHPMSKGGLARSATGGMAALAAPFLASDGGSLPQPMTSGMAVKVLTSLTIPRPQSWRRPVYKPIFSGFKMLFGSRTFFSCCISTRPYPCSASISGASLTPTPCVYSIDPPIS